MHAGGQDVIIKHDQLLRGTPTYNQVVCMGCIFMSRVSVCIWAAYSCQGFQYVYGLYIHVEGFSIYAPCMIHMLCANGYRTMSTCRKGANARAAISWCCVHDR